MNSTANRRKINHSFALVEVVTNVHIIINFKGSSNSYYECENTELTFNQSDFSLCFIYRILLSLGAKYFTMLKKGIFILLLVLGLFQLSAKEGMWIPILLEKYNLDEMHEMGNKSTGTGVI